MPDPPPEDTFEITHEARVLDFQGGRLCCIVDSSAETRRMCESFVGDGFDYNLKGIILRRSDGHQMGCRFTVKNDRHLADFRCAPSNEWISEMRRTRRLGIVDAAGVTMMVCDDLWTGDIEGVLRMFYSADRGR